MTIITRKTYIVSITKQFFIQNLKMLSIFCDVMAIIISLEQNAWHTVTFFTCVIENFSGQLAYFPFLVNISLIETLGKCLFLLNLLQCLLLCAIHLNVLSGIRSQHKIKIINSKFNLLWFCNRVVGVGQTTRQYINKNWEGEPVAYWIICVNPTLRLRLFPKLHNLL